MEHSLIRLNFLVALAGVQAGVACGLLRIDTDGSRTRCQAGLQGGVPVSAWKVRPARNRNLEKECWAQGPGRLQSQTPLSAHQVPLLCHCAVSCLPPSPYTAPSAAFCTGPPASCCGLSLPPFCFSSLSGSHPQPLLVGRTPDTCLLPVLVQRVCVLGPSLSASVQTGGLALPLCAGGCAGCSSE